MLCSHLTYVLKKTITIATILTLYSISFLVYGSSTTTTSLAVYAQSDLPTIKSRDLVIDLDNGLKTNAQLTYPAVDSGNGKYPGVLLITGSGAEDMNETGGYTY